MEKKTLNEIVNKDQLPQDAATTVFIVYHLLFVTVIHSCKGIQSSKK